MTHLSLPDIPIEVLLDNLLPALTLSELLALAQSSKFFLSVCNDDTFWKRKVQSEFNFDVGGTARLTGWKIIYRGLHKPRVYTWGRNENGRLGHSKPPSSKIAQSVPYPAELRFPGRKIVSLVSGGWSFHALDSEGQVYVWGTLNGLLGVALSSDGFSHSEKSAKTPHKLILPVAIRTISSGRMHAAALDTSHHIWSFSTWGRPFRLLHPALDARDPFATPAHVECGWQYTAVLTLTGDVYVFFPFSGTVFSAVGAKMRAMDEEGGKKAHATEDATIPCATWDLELEVGGDGLRRLPAIPVLPSLARSEDADARTEETKLVKLACMSDILVGLTNHGHVLTFGFIGQAEDLVNASWTYLPKFSEVTEIQQHEAFSGESGLIAPQDVRMTHISAQHETFVAYSPSSSASLVLLGKKDDQARNEALEPTVIPHLQNQSVISVVLGDYHYGALTADGRLLTWGGFSLGSLGLGDPVLLPVGAPGGFKTQSAKTRAEKYGYVNGPGEPGRVEVPAQVDFNGRKGQRVDGKAEKKFCFAVAAAGWHMGALVIDLEPDVEDAQTEERSKANEASMETDEDPTDQMPGGLGGSGLPRTAPGEFPTHNPPAQTPGLGSALGGVFRIGFAGRGAARGQPTRSWRGRGFTRGGGLQPPPPGGYPDPSSG